MNAGTCGNGMRRSGMSGNSTTCSGIRTGVLAVGTSSTCVLPLAYRIHSLRHANFETLAEA